MNFMVARLGGSVVYETETYQGVVEEDCDYSGLFDSYADTT
jgi:hypothetical protein